MVMAIAYTEYTQNTMHVCIFPCLVRDSFDFSLCCGFSFTTVIVILRTREHIFYTCGPWEEHASNMIMMLFKIHCIYGRHHTVLTPNPMDFKWRKIMEVERQFSCFLAGARKGGKEVCLQSTASAWSSSLIVIITHEGNHYNWRSLCFDHDWVVASSLESLW